MEMNEMEKQLEKLKQSNRQKEAELRKEIAKRKRQEKDALVKAVGELTIKTFPKCKSVDDFDKVFKFMISNAQANQQA